MGQAATWDRLMQTLAALSSVIHHTLMHQWFIRHVDIDVYECDTARVRVDTVVARVLAYTSRLARADRRDQRAY